MSSDKTPVTASMRTPLGRIRGLGASGSGPGHFIAQRVSAIALLGLVPWFLFSLLSAARGDLETAKAWIGQPVNAVLTLLTVGTALYHMRIGMQVVVEDYIQKPSTKVALLILNTFIPVVLFAAAAFSVLKIAG